MKKRWILPVLFALCVAVLTGCTSNADTMPSPSPSAAVTPMVTTSPQATSTIMPTTSAMPTSAGVMTIEDAMRVSEDVEEEVEKLSEVDEVDAVVAGNMALIGIRYDAQYQGGLTERLIEMIDARVQTVDKGVTVVHVTDDDKLTKDIDMLAEQVEKNQISFAELQTKMLDISNAISGNGMNAIPEGTPSMTQPQSTTGA